MNALAQLAGISRRIRNNYCRPVPAKVIEEGSGVIPASCLTITELRRTSGRLVGVYSASLHANGTGANDVRVAPSNSFLCDTVRF